MRTTLGRHERHDLVVRRFAEACRRGDVNDLAAILSAETVGTCDSGGLVVPSDEPVRGRVEVARFVMTLCERAGVDVAVESVNGRAGLVLREGSRAVAVLGAESAGYEITTLWIVLNPAKLGDWHRG
ncbi:hypothetical protein ACIA03_28485 [Nocardioides sp. NPDC051685]|uniref:hypothetical protein n=1 Tax=Nocardioides sp. NPDC051685 TaxID=3364334 RepID=UPI0037BD39D2